MSPFRSEFEIQKVKGIISPFKAYRLVLMCPAEKLLQEILNAELLLIMRS